MLKICLVFWKSSLSMLIIIMLIIKNMSSDKKEREKERQISEMTTTLGKYGRLHRRNIQYKRAF